MPTETPPGDHIQILRIRVYGHIRALQSVLEKKSKIPPEQ
jgi:hypothetical protein